MHKVNYIPVEQGTDEWRALRLPNASASNAHRLLAAPTTAAYKSYVAELVVARLTGVSPDRYVSRQMEYGTQMETVARTMYSLSTGNIATRSGIYIIDGKKACASLDGDVSEKGSIEIKCRELANHLESIATGKVPTNYYKQQQFQLWVTNKAWNDYVSYAEEMPENAQLFIKRTFRDEVMIADIEKRYAQLELDIAKYTKIITEYKG